MTAAAARCCIPLVSRGERMAPARSSRTTCSNMCNVTAMGTPSRECPICSTVIPDDVPMVAAEVARRQTRNVGFGSRRREAICTACAASSWRPESADGKVAAWHRGAEGVTAACEVCEHLVIVQPDKRRKVITCSEQCRLRRYKQRRVPSSVTCDVCGNTFSGRSDAHYCSPACRQKAYRARHVPSSVTG